MRYYIDACVWIDYFNERDEDIVKVVSRLIMNDTIIVSKILFKELSRCMEVSLIICLLNIYFVETSVYQHDEAKSLSNTRDVPFGDALHAVIARDNDAVLVTRDMHFRKLTDIVDIQLL